MKDLILFLTHDATSQKEAFVCEMRKFLYGLRNAKKEFVSSSKRISGHGISYLSVT